MATAASEIIPAPKRGRGRPKWEPERKLRAETDPKTGQEIVKTETADQAMARTRQEVRHYAAIGYNHDLIGECLDPPCAKDVLRRHFAYELKLGKAKADAKMAATAYRLGVTGRSEAMARFWLRCRMGWRDTGEVNGPTEPLKFQKIKGDDW